MADRLLLVLPLPAYRVAGRIYLDDQACYGLDLWLQNFSTLVLACPVQDCSSAPSATRDIASIDCYKRLTFKALPWAYAPHTFLASLPATTSLISKLIDDCSYLHFAIGGFWGDWGAVASIIAHRKQRRFAVWTDRVESQVMAFQSSTMSGLRRLYYTLNAKLAALLERYVIKRSAVGLFNGMDCFTVYSPFSSNPQLVANYNFPKGSHISDTDLGARLQDLGNRPVKLVYVGRAHKDKGVFDWITAIEAVHGTCSATWFGDGPEVEVARQQVVSLKLEHKIKFAGAISHHEILYQMKQFDVFVFCHKTLESPRCLIEALVCGLPIVGYRSDYAEQLTAKHSGGVLSDIHDVSALTASLQMLVSDTSRLAELSRAAMQDGRLYNSEEAFRHRSELIKMLGPPPVADLRSS